MSTPIKYIHAKAESLQSNELFLSDLTNEKDFVAYGADPSEIIDYTHEGKTNRERLHSALKKKDKLYYSEGGAFDISVDYPISLGSVIYIPQEYVTIEENFTSNLTVEKTVESQFSPLVLRQLSLDPGYVPTYKNRGVVGTDSHPHIAIFAWSRTRYLEDPATGWVDLTPYISNANLNSDMMSGGSFNVTLLSPTATLKKRSSESEGTSWTPEGVYGPEGEAFTTGNVNKTRLYRADNVVGEDLRRTDFYFERILHQNDLISIKLERLDLDQEVPNVQSGWNDMIGLIDSVSTSTSSQNTGSSVSIRGRDLNKVLTDDNSYFNPYALGHSQGIYGEQSFSNKRYLDGAFQDYSAIRAKTVQEQMEFIFNRIVSIGYIPDEVFLGWKDRTQITKQTSREGKATVLAETRGIWQIMKLWVDPSISHLNILDGSVSNPDGSILDLLRKTCQAPFVEFFSDTYGDKFYLMARKPPFEQSSVLQVLRELGDGESAVGLVGGAPDSDAKQAYEQYLNALESKQQADQELDFNKAKKEYLRVILDPVPYDQMQGVEDAFNALTEDEQMIRMGLSAQVTITDSVFPLIINVGENQVLSDSLRMTTEAYAWFQIDNKGDFLGAAAGLSQIPAVYFDKYAQVFGNRRMNQVSNYSNYQYFEDSKTPEKENQFVEQSTQLLAFMVETSMHLPFTREGSITIAGGDRRIKKGYYIYYRPTNEVYYVSSVSHTVNVTSRGIDRVTTVNVTRGMVREFIQGTSVEVIGEDGQPKTIQASYFNIVDIPRLKNGIYDTISTGSAYEKMDHKSDFAVNEDVFNFFLAGKQFGDLTND